MRVGEWVSRRPRRDALTQLLAEVRAETLVVQQRQQAAEAQLRRLRA